MTLPILSADQRLSEPRGIKGCIFGKSGIGKTSLLWTLPQDKTLFVDLEAGDLAVEGWKGHTLRPRTWKECRDYAVFIGGPNPALRDDQPYSQKHFDEVCERFGKPDSLNRYDTVFIDSITVAARLCFGWCKGEPQAFSDKTGKPDTRGAYGLQGQEMIAWLTHLQHTRHKNIWFVGILEEKLDDFNRRVYQPQLEGSKTSLELPGIVDQVITMAEEIQEGQSHRVFICHTLNPYGYPAKDRSGRLTLREEPHLGRLMEKIHSDPSRGWHGGYATHNNVSGSVYLNCEFTILEGPYVGRKVWNLIGLYSPKGDQWFQMGRSFLKGVLNSARGFSEEDTSHGALAARQIKSFAELDGLEFVARIDVQKNKETGEDRNIIKTALTKDHKLYAGHDSGYYAGTPHANRASASWAR